MKTMVPVAPISIKGPLGLVHLPRMWSKALLYKQGVLAEGYIAGCSFDRAVMEQLGIDLEKALGFLYTLPTYQAFEDWVVTEAGGRIEPGLIERINRDLLGRESKHRERMQKDLGLLPDSPIRTTAELNMLDDWVEFHRLMIAEGETA